VADFLSAILHVGEFLYNIFHGLHRAWDAIGGWSGLSYGLILAGCVLVLAWTLKAYWPKATAPIASDEAEEQMPAVTIEQIAAPFAYDPIKEAGEWEGYLELTEEEWENWHDPEKYFPPSYSAVVEAEGVVAMYLRGLKQEQERGEQA